MTTSNMMNDFELYHPNNSTLDDLLDKINDIGVKNLTEKEIKLLKKYSK